MEETKDPGQETGLSPIYPPGNALAGFMGLEVAGRSTNETQLISQAQHSLLLHNPFQPKSTVTSAVHPWFLSQNTAPNAVQKSETKSRLWTTPDDQCYLEIIA
jgi:hypothetical protein